MKFNRVKVFGAVDCVSGEANLTAEIEGNAPSIASVKSLVQSAPELLEMLEALHLEMTQPYHPDCEYLINPNTILDLINKVRGVK